MGKRHAVRDGYGGGEMKKPTPKYEIVVDVLGVTGYLHITVESNDMLTRLLEEMLDFGEYMQLNDIYSLTVRPTFDVLEVARWLGRGGEVRNPITRVGEKEYYYPEA